MAAAADLTMTAIMKMNSLFDSTDNSVQMSREGQRTRIATGTTDRRLARRCPDSTTVSPRGADMTFSCCRHDLQSRSIADRQ